MAAYRLYQFSNEQLRSIEDNPIFQEAIRLAVAIGFNPKPEWYRGDPEILAQLDLTDPLSWWDVLRQQPEVVGLPYLTPTEAITASTPIQKIPLLEEELEDREYLIELAETDLVAKWSFLHQTHIQSVLITGTILHLLFSSEQLPELYLHIRAGGDYATLANDQLPIIGLNPNAVRLVFDPLLQSGVELPPPSDGDLIIPYYKSLGWFVTQISTCGYPDLATRLRWHQETILSL